MVGARLLYAVYAAMSGTTVYVTGIMARAYTIVLCLDINLCCLPDIVCLHQQCLDTVLLCTIHPTPL